MKVLTRSSLPSWERGLKLISGLNVFISWKSLPSRERGLKYIHTDSKGNLRMSLPSRERGLKYLKNVVDLYDFKSLPSTGAWIEILLELVSRQ